MKKILVVVAFVLSGCAFTPPTVDPVEYNHFVELAVLVKQASGYCTSPAFMPLVIPQLQNKMEIITIYVTYRPKHEQIKEIADLLNKNLGEMQETYAKPKPPSLAYCQGKFKILESSTTRILNTVGALQ